MKHSALSLTLCVGAFGVGIATICVSAHNRARAAELDEVQRWCEIFTRQNESMRSELSAVEYRLLSGEADDELPVFQSEPGQFEELEW